MSPAAVAFWLSAIFVAAAVVSTCAALLARSDERLADVEPEPVPLPSNVVLHAKRSTFGDDYCLCGRDWPHGSAS